MAEKETNKEENIKPKKRLNLKVFLTNKNFFLIFLAIISSVSTLLFFYLSSTLFYVEKKDKQKGNIYEIAKNEAIKLGRMEPDEKEKTPKIGPDGKVIIPSLTYHDIGGMGPNSNKSFVSNIKGSKNYLSMETINQLKKEIGVVN